MPIAPRITEAELEKFIPLDDYVVIKKWAPPTVNESGLHLIPDTNNYQCKRGYVVKVGNCANKPDVKVAFNVGDQVIFSAFSGAEVPMPDGYLIMRVGEILAVLEPD